jgi:hypothetical protein
MYGRFGKDAAQSSGLVAERGQHLLRATGDMEITTVCGFLRPFGLMATTDVSAVPRPQRRFQLLPTYVIKTGSFRFTGPYIEFESFDQGVLIATNGDEKIRALCDDCTILLPARRPIVRREGV